MNREEKRGVRVCQHNMDRAKKVATELRTMTLEQGMQVMVIQ